MGHAESGGSRVGRNLSAAKPSASVPGLAGFGDGSALPSYQTGMKPPCPICEQPRVEDGDRHAPFCSERCKLLDLDHWLGGDYRIPGPAAVDRPPLEPTDDPSDDPGSPFG